MKTPDKNINQSKGFRIGDLVYMKIAKRGSKGEALQFAGHGVGVFIGHVAPFQKDFDALDAFRALGRFGFVSFDDLQEFLGPEQTKACIDKFDMKYFAISDNAPKVIGVDGKPIAIKNEEQK